MNEEVKEILDGMKKANNENCNLWLENVSVKLLYNYITNLQNDLKYQKEMEDEYIEKHTKLLQDFTNLQKENERLNTELNAYKDEFCKDTIKEYELVMEQEDYKSRCEKAIEFVKKESKKCYSNQITDNPAKVIGNFMWHTDKLLNILNGGDEE